MKENISYNKTKSQVKQGKGKGKYILIGLGVVALAGTAIYFATRPKKPQPNVLPDEVRASFENQAVAPAVRSRNRSSSGFPLKKGSRGELVRNIQEALIEKYGAGILPKYGADGIWGNELETALKSKGISTRIDSTLFTKLIGSKPETNPTNAFNPNVIATDLRLAILDRDIDKAKVALRQIDSVSAYTQVNVEFKKKRLNGVRKTIVNGLLTAFNKVSDKKELNAEFHRIGLKFNGTQWSLNGSKVDSRLNESKVDNQLKGDLLKSIVGANIWDASGAKMKIEKDTILGEFIDARNEITKFRTSDNHILFIQTKNISYV